MKKILLVCLTLATGLGVFAQNQRVQQRYPQGFRKAEVPAALRNRKTLINKQDALMDNVVPINNLQSRQWTAPTRPHFGNMVQTEEVIGYTYYDSQTNSGISNRIVNNGDGTISAAWTFSPNATSGYPQRGTGYDYYDGTQWIYSATLGNIPNSKIEPNSRTGFTNIVVTGSGQEMAIAHSSTAGHMLLTSRPAKGTGSWTEQTNSLGTGTNNDTWSKAIATHDTVYAIWQGSGTSGVALYGQTGPILFSRSDDGGQTWSILRAPIPQIDSTQYRGFGGDDYSIDARNGVVAIAYGGQFMDVGLLKSTDGGQTWTKSIIQTFGTTNQGEILPTPLFNSSTQYTYLHGPGTPVDTMDGSMGDQHVLIDDHGMCHVFFSQMYYWRDSSVTTAGSYFFRPYQSDVLWYWNESMATDGYVAIASAQDYNGDGVLNFASPTDTTCALLGEYRGGMTQMPSAGFNNSNSTMYVAYQSVCEGCDTTAYHELHKHVYVITSPDYGHTWTYPYDIAPSVAQGGDGENQECVFACVAKTVDNNVYIVYQRDPAPGTALNTADACEAANNSGASDIVATMIESSTVGINTVHSNDMVVTQNAPNPAHDMTAINITLKRNSDIRLQVSDILGNVIYTDGRKNANTGTHTMTLNTSGLPGGIYFYSVEANGIKVTKKMIVN